MRTGTRPGRRVEEFGEEGGGFVGLESEALGGAFLEGARDVAAE